MAGNAQGQEEHIASNTEKTSPVESEQPQDQPLDRSDSNPRSPSPSGPLKRKASKSPSPSEPVSKVSKATGESEDGELPPEDPPLPNEPLPPLPDEPPPDQGDDGWEPVWDESAQAYYFYNRFTQATQWENPRVPEAPSAAQPTNHDRIAGGALQIPLTSVRPAAEGGYNPAIHGDYDPNADYAQLNDPEEDNAEAQMAANSGGDNNDYSATGRFNRFTGRFQHDGIDPENLNDENKSKRQMSAFFDVDTAANKHDGRSLKAERQGRKLTKAELQAFKKKQKEKKEEKRRAWLRD